MLLLTKDDYFAAEDLPLVAFPMPEYGPDPETGEERGFWIRTQSADERCSMEISFAGQDPRDDPRKFRTTVVALCTVDANGVRMFEVADAKAMLSKAAGPFERLCTAICALNGFSKKDVEELEGNSEANQ